MPVTKKIPMRMCRQKLLNRTFSADIPAEIYERIREEYLAGKK